MNRQQKPARERERDRERDRVRKNTWDKEERPSTRLMVRQLSPSSLSSSSSADNLKAIAKGSREGGRE